MGRDTTINNRTLSWRNQIRQIREDKGLGESGLGEVPDAVTLTLIAIESSGNPAAFNPRSKGKATGLLAITEINAIDIDKRVIAQFDGRNPDIQPLGSKAPPNSNPELIAGQNSLRHFYDFNFKYRRRINKDPLRMALAWKAGPPALRRLNESIGIETSLLSEEGLAYMKSIGSRSDSYVLDFARLIGEAREKLGSSVPRDFTPSGKTYTTWFSVDRTFDSSDEKLKNYQSELPDCLPSHELRASGPSAERRALARRTRESALKYGEVNFVENIRSYLGDLSELSRVKNPRKYTKRHVNNVQTFLQEAENNEETGVARNLRVAFGNTEERFVKPLEVFDVRQPFGQERVRRIEDGTEYLRRHLGVDLETRDPAQVQKRLLTAAFLTSSGTIRDNFGQKNVYAIADGEVILSGRLGAYGLVVYLEHEGAVTSRYGHLSSIDPKAKKNAKVKKGQVIGVSGTTEIKNGKVDHSGVKNPHLHFEIRVNIEASRGNRPSSRVSNVQNIALDPAALLARAPGPLDPPKVKTRPEEQAILDAKEAAANLLMNATTDHGRLVAAQAYDQACAQLRGCSIANMTRADCYSEQSRVASTQRNVVEQSSQIEDAALTSYSQSPPES